MLFVTSQSVKIKCQIHNATYNMLTLTFYYLYNEHK